MAQSKYYWRVIYCDMSIKYYKAQIIYQILYADEQPDSITDIQRVGLVDCDYVDNNFKGYEIVNIPFVD